MDLESPPTQETFTSTGMRKERNPETLASLLSFSCHNRAETFARKLQLKLNKLGSYETETLENYNHSSNNNSMPTSTKYPWLPQGVTTSSQTSHKSNSNGINFNPRNVDNRQNKVMISTRSEPAHLPSHYKNFDANNTINSTIYHSLSTSAVEMLADSDFFFDFDIASPELVSEEPDFPNTVINQCDDLHCPDCASICAKTPTATEDCNSHSFHNNNNNEKEIESGCIFSSPTGSTSPDHETGNIDCNQSCHGVLSDAPAHWLSPVQDELYSTPSAHDYSATIAVSENNNRSYNGSDVGDCSSETSDSIYYDVDSASPSLCCSPKINSFHFKDEETSKGEENGTLVIKVEGKCEPKDLSCENVKTLSSSYTETTKEAETKVGVKTRPNNLDLSEAKKGNLLGKEDASNSGASSSESDDDNSSDFVKKMRRCSSLKTGKTPPGTPSNKKIVRFADVLGLDLADVRTFLDEIPSVPKSAYSDLDLALDAMSLNTVNTMSARLVMPEKPVVSKTLLPSFHQPVSTPDFFDKIRDQKVLLENAYVGDNFTIKGMVRVMNLDFHKSVYIRYTMDDWRTLGEVNAIYVAGSCDGFSDRFEFSIPINMDRIDVGGKFCFAVRFHCQGQQFWDSNFGRNYVFHCVPSSSQRQQTVNAFEINTCSTSTDEPWINHMWM